MRDEALVLHVDVPAVTELTERRLPEEQSSLSVVTAETAAEGLAVLDERPVECVVSDYALPDRDGLAFLEAVRERDGDLPFVLYTGRGSETVASEAIAAGVTDYLRKRTDGEQYSLLANRVVRAVEQYRAERRADRRTTQQELVADLGQRALGEPDLPTLFEEAVEALVDGLDVDEAALLALDEDAVECRATAGEGARRADDDSTAAGAVGHEQLRTALKDGSPVLPDCDDGGQCICAPVREADRLVLVACSGDERRFVDDDVTFVRSVANVLASETDRQAHIAELELKDQAFDAAPGGIVITDPDQPDNPIVYASDGFCELTGYDRETVLGRNCRFLQGEGTDPEPVAELRDAVEAGEPASVELRNYRANGTEFWNRVEIAPVTQDGELTNFVGFQRDVSDRKERERQLTLLHEATRELVGADDAEGVAATVVETVRDVLGFGVAGVRLLDGDRLEPVAMTDARREVLGPAPTYDADGDSPPARALRDDETVLLEEMPDADGGNRRETLSTTIYLPLGEHGTVSVGTTDGESLTGDDRRLLEMLAANAAVALDRLDEQRRVSQRERELQREHHRLAALFDNAVDPTLEYAYEGDDGIDPAGGEPIVQAVNDAFERVFGYDESAAVGRHVDDLVVPPGHEEEAANIDEQVRAGERVDADVRRRTAGGELRDFRFRNIPIPDESTRRGYAVYTDVTRRKAREQRLQVLNRVLRHNLRNDMNVILGIAELVQRDLDDPELSEELSALQRVAERLLDRSSYARTIEETLEEDGSDRRVDVATLAAEEVAKLAERAPDAEVETDLPEEALASAGASLRTAIRELLTNAVEHNDGDSPRVELSVDVERRADARHVVVAVADDGPGIPDHERSVLVDGTETPLEHGSGLGLWLVRWVVHGAGGWLTIEDGDAGGSCVTMHLPASGGGSVADRESAGDPGDVDGRADARGHDHGDLE